MSFTNRPIIGFSNCGADGIANLQEAYGGSKEPAPKVSNNELRRLVKRAEFLSRHTIAGILAACLREPPTYGPEMWL